MDDGLGKIEVISDHFQASTPRADSQDTGTPSSSQPKTDESLSLGLTAVFGLEENLEVLHRC